MDRPHTTSAPSSAAARVRMSRTTPPTGSSGASREGGVQAASPLGPATPPSAGAWLVRIAAPPGLRPPHTESPISGGTVPRPHPTAVCPAPETAGAARSWPCAAGAHAAATHPWSLVPHSATPLPAAPGAPGDAVADCRLRSAFSPCLRATPPPGTGHLPSGVSGVISRRPPWCCPAARARRRDPAACRTASPPPPRDHPSSTRSRSVPRSRPHR